VNYGRYYTPPGLVDVVYEMLRRRIPDLGKYAVIDTSCGYGNFLRLPNSIGADCDADALIAARQNAPTNSRFFQHNSLQNTRREHYGLTPADHIIIVGNPPYNDTTSLIRNHLKREPLPVDPDLKRRDLGLSFLLSYAKLAADFICVLHPLSYLIKSANFALLGELRRNYRLADALICSSGEFSATSKITAFPIVIALYERAAVGVDYDFIRRYAFPTKEGRMLRLDQFDSIGNYITKYPNHAKIPLAETAAFFWTMRDINALKRTRTFVEKECYNTIRVPQKRLPYYCYVDAFKDYLPRVPYYLGNSDVMVDDRKFHALANVFVARSCQKHPALAAKISAPPFAKSDEQKVDNYFHELLGEHYVA
jgi:hypothetical protein